MLGIGAIAGGILDIGGKIIEKIWPDPAQRDKAKLELLKLQQEGEFKELETRMSAIIAEAKSNDKWTSRARPSFMYVMYTYILLGPIMGVAHVINPTTAASMADGVNAWLLAIPTEMWSLFGVGFLGYVGARSYDKSKLTK